jgi:predicted dehydrogenase
MLRVGVVGYGYWGPNLVRNFMASDRATVVAVSDLSEEKLTRLARQYPAVETTTDCQKLLENPGVDVVVVATPVSSHFKLALSALRAGKHVLIEKPMTETPEEAEQLIEEADKRGLTLMVDHTFLYTGAVRKIYELVTAGELGDILYYDSSRVNLGLFQHDVDVIWDLAVHDFSILDYLLDGKPTAVAAHGTNHFLGKPENIAFVTIFFDTGTIAHVNVNWLAPVKLRRTLIGGSRKMIVYNDLEPSEKVKVFDKGVTVTDDPGEIYQMKIGYRVGDVWAPRLDETEALSSLVEHFLDSIEQGTQPVTGGPMGLRVVTLLKAASESMKNGGHTIVVDHSRGQL